jgi:hypothetical protein
MRQDSLKNSGKNVRKEDLTSNKIPNQKNLNSDISSSHVKSKTDTPEISKSQPFWIERNRIFLNA